MKQVPNIMIINHFGLEEKKHSQLRPESTAKPSSGIFDEDVIHQVSLIL